MFKDGALTTDLCQSLPELYLEVQYSINKPSHNAEFQCSTKLPTTTIVKKKKNIQNTTNHQKSSNKKYCLVIYLTTLLKTLILGFST